MKIYEIEKRFDPKTGKPARPEISVIQIRCDYCGRVVADYTENGSGKDMMEFPYVQFEFHPWNDSVQVPQFEEYPIERDMFFGSCVDAGRYGACHSCQNDLHKDFAEQVLEKHPQGPGWESFWITARWKTAKKLLDSGEIRPYQLFGYGLDLPKSREDYEERVEEGYW